MLTAVETFTGPSLTDLILVGTARRGHAPGGIDRMLQSLEAQLTGGPSGRPGFRRGRRRRLRARGPEPGVELRAERGSAAFARTPERRRDTEARRPGDRGRRDFAESAKCDRRRSRFGSRPYGSPDAIPVTDGPDSLPGHAAAAAMSWRRRRSRRLSILGAEPELIGGSPPDPSRGQPDTAWPRPRPIKPMFMPGLK